MYSNICYKASVRHASSGTSMTACYMLQASEKWKLIS